MGTKDRCLDPGWTYSSLQATVGTGWGEAGADATGPTARSQRQRLCSLSLLMAQVLTWAQQTVD